MHRDTGVRRVRDRERQSFKSLVHSSDVSYFQGCTTGKQRKRDSIWIFHVGDRSPDPWAMTCYSLVYRKLGSGVEPGLGYNHTATQRAQATPQLPHQPSAQIWLILMWLLVIVTSHLEIDFTAHYSSFQYWSFSQFDYKHSFLYSAAVDVTHAFECRHYYNLINAKYAFNSDSLPHLSSNMSSCLSETHIEYAS